MVNSRWTFERMELLWERSLKLVHPPCSTEAFGRLPLSEKQDNTIISLAQFRPEKNHAMQLHILRRYFDLFPARETAVRLIIVGSCRNADDLNYLTSLKDLAWSLGLNHRVNFIVNLSFGKVLEELQKAGIGLHTMRDEHFGIGVVELMLAGVIPIAHNSGGPRDDIIKEDVGFLASDVDEYVEKLDHIFRLQPSQRTTLRISARLSARRFSEDNFQKAFLDCLNGLL
ncbi:GDP-Man:Man(3)GlcNAc(2)-PP-Dol alpha-1,2-mannosyltransferase-like [Zophobas morio]|uniref:GDP-Man:Man(3)GlcNAc(2)-PP-Dol alpha-1,2-mannosyltransferase-like n=1 Tax=Zophobas morio TaxID=2755281 RepID=UPI0030835336